MAIGDDFAIDYTNKRIYHASGTTVYNVNDLYSWLMDTFDELTQMDDPVPMSAQTPTEYTMINEWFLDEGEGSFAHKYLKNGAIKTSGYDGNIQVLKLDDVLVDPVSTDIGKQVMDDGTEIGVLLGYLLDPDGTNTGKWWIRSTSTIADNSVIRVSGGSGLGTWTASTSYSSGTYIVPTTENGWIYECTTAGNSAPSEPTWPTTEGSTVNDLAGYATWAASTAYALGDYVVPTTSNGFYYECTTAGTSGTTEPTWPTTAGATVTDGTVVWTCRQPAVWTTRGQADANADSVTGEDLFANVYTLGTIESAPAPQIYIFQAGSAIAEWSNLTNWDRGHIDVLIKVKEAGMWANDLVDACKSYNANTAAYTDETTDINNATANDVALPPIQTTTTGDAIYFGDSDTFDHLRLNVGTAGVYSDITISWEYWNGSAWTSLTVTDGTNGFQNSYMHDITFSPPSDWATTAVDGLTKYWIRAVASLGAAPAITTAPLATQGWQGTPDVTVFARQSGDLFDNYEIDLSAGGRNAVPLSTSDDLNEDTGEYYLLYDAETAGFTTLGQIVTGGTSGATAELVAVTDWGTEGLLTLRGVKGTFQDNETISGETDGSATVNGTVGDTYLLYDAETGAFTVGNVVTGGTSGAKRILRGLQDDGTTGKMVLQVDSTQTGSNRTPYYKTFEDNETITDTGTGSATANGASTTIVSGWDDITIAFVNGTCTHSGTTGTFTPGERVTYTGGEAILLEDSGTALTLGNVTNTALNGLAITGDLSGATATATQDLQIAHTMDKAFQQQSAYPYAVIVNAGDIYAAGRTLAEVYEYFKFVCQENSTFSMYTIRDDVTITVLDGEEYIIAYAGYSPTKAAPFGTFAGGKYFGAQGVWIEGMASGQSYQFTDANGNIRQPYASVDISITNTLSGDRVSVFRTSAGAIQKDIYTSAATGNNQGNSTFVVQETISIDTPSSGVLRIVDSSENKEHRMRYASWSGSTFTLLTARTGTQTGSESATVLVDSAATFVTWGILVGDIITNTTDGSWAQVASVDSETQLTTTALTGGTDNLWQLNDGYSIHTLPVTYDGTDTAYVPFIDQEATSTSITITVLYSADRTVLVRARRKQATPILPFETSATVTSAGLTVAVIRTEDAIVT
jgi:hypothetical protein